MIVARHSVDVRQNIIDTAQTIMAAKGFSAVGLNEILVSAGVPKGSFYHYFGSKDAFGESLLNDYFEAYLADMDELLADRTTDHADRLMAYWRKWQETQGSLDCQGKCLAVKLAAEVSDLSEAMRASLKRGTVGIVERLSKVIEAAASEGSLTIEGAPLEIAETLYHLWLGASLRAKIVRSSDPFESAMLATRRILKLPSS